MLVTKIWVYCKLRWSCSKRWRLGWEENLFSAFLDSRLKITKFICNLTYRLKCLEIPPFHFRWPTIIQNSLDSWYSASNFYSVNLVIILPCPLAGNQIHHLIAIVTKLCKFKQVLSGLFNIYIKQIFHNSFHRFFWDSEGKVVFEIIFRQTLKLLVKQNDTNTVDPSWV